MKASARQAQGTADVFKFNYLKVTGSNGIYHCTSHAEEDARSNDPKWQIVLEDAEGSLYHAVDSGGVCNPDFNKQISLSAGGADSAYLDSLTFWTP